MRFERRSLLVVAVLLVTVSALAVPGASSVATPARSEAGPPSISRTTKKIAPGLTLTRIVDKRTPRRTFVLRGDLSAAISLDVTLAGPRFPTRARTSRMAVRAGAIAAVNGDFGSDRGYTTHPFAEDGHLVRTSAQLGSMFAVSADEQRVFLGRAVPDVTATETQTGRVLDVDHWNDGGDVPGEISGFTSVGGTLEPPPQNACSVHLAPVGQPAAADPDGVDQSFTVDQVACQEPAMAPAGGVVLSATPASDEAIELLSLPTGAQILLHWTFGWPDVLSAIGGVPLLVADGRIAVPRACSSSFCRSNPRTGIGVTAGGRILLVVVDGRQPRWSVGPTMYQFARIMKGLGATFAMNLDGGGSSTMVVRGKVVNRPSDGFERKVTSAVLILP